MALLALTGLQAQALAQQWSGAPSDATTSLTFTNTPTGDNINPAFPATCPTGGNNGPFSFANATAFTAPSALIPYPVCATDVAIPGVPPSYPNDMWFRLDPTTGTGGNTRDFRFTIIPGSAPLAGDYAGIAVYEGTSATGALRLLNCSRDGGYKTAQRGPSVEATCITPGNKLYIRVWTYQPSLPNFSICVLNHTQGTYTGANDRKAGETACAAPDVAAGTTVNLHYSFSCREPGFELMGDRADGGDLWLKLTIPASGQVVGKLMFGTSATSTVGGSITGTTVAHVGATAYLSDNCSDASKFREVGYVDELVSQGATAPNNLIIRCLPPGETLYIRIHGARGSNARTMRYGMVGFKWTAGSMLGDPTGNSQPCGALPITVGATCSGQISASNAGHCSAFGVPQPACGNFNTTKSSVWYKFEAPPSGLVQIDLKAAGAPALDPAMALYTANALATDADQGCKQAMGLVSCDDRQGEGLDSRIIKGGLLPGQIYYIRVWSKGATDGNFTLCVSSPQPPAGHCWYMIDLWSQLTNNPYGGTLPRVEVTVPYPGGTTTNYPAHGNDGSEVFLVAVPTGVTVHFHFFPQTSGAYFWALWNPQGGDALIWQSGGMAVFGPAAAPVYTFTTTSCEPPQHLVSDCFGMETICIDGAGNYGPYPAPGGGQYYLDQLFFVNQPNPLNSNGNPWSGYDGGNYHPNTGSMVDLAGANMGCLDGEAGGISWYVVRPQADGTLGFVVRGWNLSAGTTPIDVDFAIWDLGVLDYNLPPDMDHIDGYDVCPPSTAPVRCSSARRVSSTGLMPNMQEVQEGHGGWGWLKPLDVQQGHAYLLALKPVDAIGSLRYDVMWMEYSGTNGQPNPGLIDCTPLTLPVELLFLEGMERNGRVDLTWATASEKNSSHFVVERSADAVDFLPIGQVKAGGNSQHRLDYGFTDDAPYGGVNYYRLRQVDLDGRWEYSNTVVVVFQGRAGEISVWPNPVHDRFSLGLDVRGHGMVTVQLIDPLGRLLREQEIPVGAGPLEVDGQGLAQGTYLVRVLDEGGASIGATRFLKD